MNCAKARTNFSAYVEQELSEGDRRAVSTHLARCEHCSRDLFAMQKAVNLLRWLPKADARPGFEDRLSEQLHAPAEQPSTWAWLERWRGFGESLAAGARGLLGETLIATPASALLVAILVGTGGGALVMREVMKSSGRAPGGLAASTPEIMSAPGVATNAIPAELAAAAAGAPVVPVVNPPAATPTPEASQLAAADANPAPPASSRPQATTTRRAGRRAIEAPVLTASNPGRVRPGMEVAPWAKNQQPIEGPPSVAQIEYILDQVDVNKERVLQLPASAVVSGGTVTF